MGFLNPTLASRKYIDLLKKTSSKWANWDPPRRIRAGDFGTIDRKSGEFNCEGNLYDNLETKVIAAQYPAEEMAGEESLIIRSHQARETRNDVGFDSSLMNIGSALLSVEIHFSKERGAFLIMHNVYMTIVPYQLLLALKGKPVLKGKVFVTQIFSCNGYAQYMSNGGEYTVSVSLSGATDALACTAPISGGARASTSWHAKGFQGMFRHAYDNDRVYVPLFSLKSFQRRCVPGYCDHAAFYSEPYPPTFAYHPNSSLFQNGRRFSDANLPFNEVRVYEDEVEPNEDDVQEDDMSDILESADVDDVDDAQDVDMSGISGSKDDNDCDAQDNPTSSISRSPDVCVPQDDARVSEDGIELDDSDIVELSDVGVPWASLDEDGQDTLEIMYAKLLAGSTLEQLWDKNGE